MKNLKIKTSIYTIAAFSLVIAVCLFFLLELGMPIAKAEPYKASLEVKNLYNDVGIIGYESPFKITIKNNGKRIQGELQFINGAKFERTIFAMSVDIPENTTQEYSLSIPVLDLNDRDNLEVLLVENNSVLVKELYSFRKILPPYNSTICILSEEKGKLNFLANTTANFSRNIEFFNNYSGGNITEANPEIIEIEPKDFPKDVDLLDYFNIIIIDNFDTSSLTDQNLLMLAEWVKKGNLLIVGTGLNYNKVLTGLANKFMIDKPSTAEQKPFPKNLENFTQQPIPKNSKLEIASFSDINKNFNFILSDGSSPLAFYRDSGKGKICVLAFSPSSKAFSSWQGSVAFFNKLLKQFNNISEPSLYFENHNKLTQELTNNFLLPNTSVSYKIILIIFIVYILIIGPLLYIILKIKDKKEYSLIIIPVISVLFVIILYIYGSNTSYSKPILSSINYIELDNTSSKTFSKFNILNNKKSKLSVKYPKDLKLLNFNLEFFNDVVSEQPKRIYQKFTYSDQPQYECFQSGLWNSHKLKAISNKNENGITTKAFLTDDFKLKLEISNTSDYDLKDAMVVFGFYYFSVGDINAKNTYSFVLDLNNSNYSKTADFLAEKFNIADAVHPDIYYFNPYNQPYERKKIILTANNYILCSDYIIRSNILDNSIFGGYIIGHNFDDTNLNLSINNEIPDKYIINVIYSEFNIDLESNKSYTFSDFEVPLNINYEISPYYDTRIMYSYWNKIDNIYTPFKEIKLNYILPNNIKIEQFKIDWAVSKDIKYEIFNNSTQQWENLSSSPYTSEIANKYIKADNINLRAVFTTEDKGAELIRPYITVKLKGADK